MAPASPSSWVTSSAPTYDKHILSSSYVVCRTVIGLFPPDIDISHASVSHQWWPDIFRYLQISSALTEPEVHQLCRHFQVLSHDHTAEIWELWEFEHTRHLHSWISQCSERSSRWIWISGWHVWICLNQSESSSSRLAKPRCTHGKSHPRPNPHYSPETSVKACISYRSPQVSSGLLDLDNLNMIHWVGVCHWVFSFIYFISQCFSQWDLSGVIRWLEFSNPWSPVSMIDIGDIGYNIGYNHWGYFIVIQWDLIVIRWDL